MIKKIYILYVLIMTILVILCMQNIMADRSVRHVYREKKYSDFSGRNNQEYFDFNNPTRFFKSNGLQNNPDDGRLELAEDYPDDFVKADIFEPNDNAKPIATISNTNINGINKNIVAVNEDEDVVKVYKKDDNDTNYSLLYTFVGAYNYPNYVIGFRNKVLIFISFGAGYDRKVAYSTNFGTSFTVVSWAYGNVIDHVIGVDGKIYALDENGTIARSADGITWELYYDGDTSKEQITGIEELDGQLYVSIASTGGQSHLAKLYDGVLQYIYAFEGDRGIITIKNFDNRIIISSLSKGSIVLYEYNKGDVQKLTTINYQSYAKVRLHVATDDFLYLSASLVTGNEARYLFRMNKKNGVFLLKDFGDNVNINAIVNFSGQITIHTQTTAGDNITVFDNRESAETVPTGEIELPILDFKQRPVYLVARHKPLGANATLTIKGNVNHASGYATSLLSNTVDNSIETIIKLKDIITDDITALQLRITLADSTPTNGIEDLEILFLYNDKGLENLKD